MSIDTNNIMYNARMGTLHIVSTPIGNLEDITLRAIRTLRDTDIILCEDTRRTGLLMDRLDIKGKKLLSYYDEIEDRRLPEVVQMLGENRNIALVSDAGTPLVSDPGFRLVRECRKRGIRIESIPGPSAFLAALTSSGLPADKFTFLGYPQEKQSHRVKLFGEIQPGYTTILYAAPHKLLQILEDLKSVLGDQDITLARELTKIHEEIWSGKISGALSHFPAPQGEFVVLFRRNQ